MIEYKAYIREVTSFKGPSMWFGQIRCFDNGMGHIAAHVAPFPTREALVSHLEKSLANYRANATAWEETDL